MDRSIPSFQQIVPRSYWTVELSTGITLEESSLRYDLRRATTRTIDWTLDLVSTGDHRKITQIGLILPGQTMRPMVPVKEPGTAFQLKHSTISILGRTALDYQLVGVVTDKLVGTCICLIWDAIGGLIAPYETCITDIKPWREGMLPIGKLDTTVLGLEL